MGRWCLVDVPARLQGAEDFRFGSGGIAGLNLPPAHFRHRFAVKKSAGKAVTERTPIRAGADAENALRFANDPQVI